MIFCAVQLLEHGSGIVQQDVALVLLLILRQGHGAGIQIYKIRIDVAGGHMGVAVQQNVAGLQRRQVGSGVAL